MSVAEIVMGIVEEHGLRKSGKRFIGPCPFCGGSKNSDKFQIQLDGGYKCYACGKRGDIITWLREKEQLSCAEAHARADIACRQASSCAVAESCRFGKPNTQKNGKRPFQRRHTPARPYGSIPGNQEKKEIRDLPTIEPAYPSASWLNHLTQFTNKAHVRMAQDQAAPLAYLAARGIDGAAAERFHLGWLTHQYQIPRQKIALPLKEGKDKLWIPGGILIPIYRRGNLHRIRIRRTPEDRERFKPDLKYYWVPGSGNLPLSLPASCDTPRGAVIVEAELDAFAIAAAHPEVVVVALGSLSSGIDAVLWHYLANLPCILLALDAEAKAAEHIKSWQKAFNHARFWPTPQAKDAGDYASQGGDLKEWIEAGLPSRSSSVSSVSVSHDRPFLLAEGDNGWEGEEKNTKETPENKDHETPENPEKAPVEVSLLNGRTFYMVEKKETQWEALTAQGHAVFTRAELERFKEATTLMNEEERLEAATTTIDVKEMFGGYLSRGINRNDPHFTGEKHE